MPKLLASIAISIFIILSSVLRTSRYDDHPLFFVEGDDLATVMNNDGSFGELNGFDPARFILSAISRIISLNTGEYIIHKNEEMLSVINRIIRHDCITRKITFPEGMTVKMIVESLNNNELLTGIIDEIPEEGTLAPDTYFYRFMDTKKSIIKKMEVQMKNMLSKIDKENKTKLTTKEIVILASIIEKEASVDSERKLVSSVFHNRLNKKMRLQSCPTVIYAVSNGYGKIGRKLTKDDLFFESQYNTYRHAGLTPTAICCPGAKSIDAAMNPANSKYLFFVANPDEVTHSFSDSFDEHKRNKVGSLQKKIHAGR
jgi:UPF0755 protein